ncbi:N-acyl amino acid synthase, PEP-CTERM/exosortase system-associated [Rhodoferax sp. OV413]|uniref:PEP-CTERM/exosortase system-associated acyltransferase n=1 Tax=Rhodoferax sp. OV413 TaxID=1855285 RepID=UPI000885C385|nr:PEP-CTERM/exosortase system-associated acyltransferase [Rhodoferax sp. OV413]SDO07447.1 N-acyl amino acid synthase, PEP-CTERM/exosortase system-associated [Rhodoferax sp. OV413]
MTEQSRPNLGDGYKQYFEIAPALDQARINDVFFIRHDVYARELGFEPVREDQRETDKYDYRSLHCLVRSADGSRLAGCARLVLTDPQDQDSPLPFEVTCKNTLDRSIIDPAKQPRARIAEVSRLAVMSEFRRRKGEQQSEAMISEQDFGDRNQPRFPYLPVSLYMGAVIMAKRQGIETLFTLTEPRLAEHFAKLGVNIMPIGGPVEHRGQRLPSMLRVDEVYQGLRLLIRPLWHVINAQIDEAYAKASV